MSTSELELPPKGTLVKFTLNKKVDFKDHHYLSPGGVYVGYLEEVVRESKRAWRKVRVTGVPWPDEGRLVAIRYLETVEPTDEPFDGKWDLPVRKLGRWRYKDGEEQPRKILEEMGTLGELLNTQWYRMDGRWTYLTAPLRASYDNRGNVALVNDWSSFFDREVAKHVILHDKSECFKWQLEHVSRIDHLEQSDRLNTLRRLVLEVGKHKWDDDDKIPLWANVALAEVNEIAGTDWAWDSTFVGTPEGTVEAGNQLPLF